MNPSKGLWSFFSLLVAWLFFFWPVICSIFQGNQPIWITLSTYGITFVTSYLIYLKRDHLKKALFVTSQFGLLTLFVLACIFVFANVNHVQYAEKSAVMLMIPALALTAFGPVVVQIILFPLLYLMLIIPLQDVTLQNRSIILWVAIGILIAYLGRLKFYKPKVSLGRRSSVWVLQNTRWLVPTVIACGLLTASPWLGENIRTFYPIKRKEIVIRAPLGTQGWRGPVSVTDKTWEPLYPNASAILQAQYFLSAAPVEDNVYLYSAYFDSDRSFSEIFDAHNDVFNPSFWKKTDFKTTLVDLGNQKDNAIFEVQLRSNSGSRLVWYWYYVAGFSTTDFTAAELLDKVRVIARYAQGSGIIVVSTSYDTTPEEARERLRAFLKVMYNALDVVKRPEINYTQYSHLGR